MRSGEWAELEAVSAELRSVIRKLEELSGTLQSGFTGIGNEYAARAVEMAAGKCRLAKKRLEGLDLTAVTEAFAKRMGPDREGQS